MTQLHFYGQLTKEAGIDLRSLLGGLKKIVTPLASPMKTVAGQASNVPLPMKMGPAGLTARLTSNPPQSRRQFLFDAMRMAMNPGAVSAAGKAITAPAQLPMRVM